MVFLEFTIVFALLLLVVFASAAVLNFIITEMALKHVDIEHLEHRVILVNDKRVYRIDGIWTCKQQLTDVEWTALHRYLDKLDLTQNRLN